MVLLLYIWFNISVSQQLAKDSSAFQDAASVCAHARTCQGEGWKGEKEEELPVMLILQTRLNQAQQTQELFVTCDSSEKEIFAGMK